MIRSLRDPRPNTAALLRLVAFLVALGSVVAIPAKFAAAAAGHNTVFEAFTWATGAVALTVAMALVARSLDPMRRR